VSAPTAGEASLRHLFGRLAVLERRVAWAVAERRRVDPDPDDGFHGLYLSDEKVDVLLAGGASALLPAGHDPAAELLGAVEAEADAAEAAGEALRVRGLQRAFELDDLDLDVVLTALAPDLDPRFEQLYGYLHDDVTRRRASPRLAVELAGRLPTDGEARWRLSPAGPLVRRGLLELDDVDRPFLSRVLRVPDRVAAHLLGHDAPDAALRGVVVGPRPLATPDAERVARALAAGVALVQLREAVPALAASVAVAACAAAGRGALVVDLTRAGSAPGEVDALVVVALREAALTGAALVAGPVDELGPEARRLLGGAPGTVVLTGSAHWDALAADRTPLVVDLDRPRGAPAPLLDAAGVADPAVRDLATHALGPFRLGPRELAQAVDVAGALAAADGTRLSGEHLAAGARAQNGAALERLARRVEPSAGWDDIVLAPATVAELRHLAARVEHRGTVLDGWGLRRGGGRGESVTALFTGDSGTGKTMAAEVIAGDLGLDLYVIDLSTVVDKYVGETEKNLERVFAAAEGVNGVLFFDEADAVFGKRSEVTDARDRYANVETAYLLQRLERFDGLAVLASNLRANVDEAFTRRLSLVIDFAPPDVAQRLRLWATHTARLPLAGDVDLPFCATAFELSGGNVRNVAVTAAYLAATDGAEVAMVHVIRAVAFEYRKLGRLCLEAEFGPWLAVARSVA
jgi:hypothetical protein